MAGKPGRFNPDKVSGEKKKPCLQALAPNSGNFRDPLANKRGRKPNDHPWRGSGDRWITQTWRVVLADLDKVRNEAGMEGFDSEILHVLYDSTDPRRESGIEFIVSFKKHFFKRETKP